MQKKFLRTLAVFGSLFALQLLDPTSSTYGMQDEMDTTPKLKTIKSHHSYEEENMREKDIQKYRATEKNCPHTKSWIVKSVHEFKLEDYYGQPLELANYYCKPCWEEHCDAKCRNLQTKRDAFENQ